MNNKILSLLLLSTTSLQTTGIKDETCPIKVTWTNQDFIEPIQQKVENIGSQDAMVHIHNTETGAQQNTILCKGKSLYLNHGEVVSHYGRIFRATRTKIPRLASLQNNQTP